MFVAESGELGIAILPGDVVKASIVIQSAIQPRKQVALWFIVGLSAVAMQFVPHPFDFQQGFAMCKAYTHKLA